MRNSTGIYTLALGNPVQPGTTITTAWANSTLQDLASEMTNSLSRDGQGDMRAPLRVPDGTAPQPTFSFVNDPASGTYLAAASDVRLAVASVARQTWTPTLTTISTPASLSSTLAVTGNTTVGGTMGITGNTTVGGTLGVTGAATSAGIGSTTTLPTTGTGFNASNYTAIGDIGTTTGNNYPIHTFRTKAPGANQFGLSFRVRNYTTVTDWYHTRVGLTFDVGSAVGAGGYFYIGDGGAILGVGASGLFPPATATTPSTALKLEGGYLSLDGVTAPNSNVAVKNTITPKNIVKATASITTAASQSVTVSDGVNISGGSVNALSTEELTVTFAQAFSNTTYQVAMSITSVDSAGTMDKPEVKSRTTSSMVIRPRRTTSSFGSWNTGYTLDIIVVGAQ